ncbi:MAG: undecaprenyl-diphosphatase UppP [Chloroflexi bacterium]|nr:undecaprenyl-diphosphatase UppP [Chloroflexota bacterium]
MTLFQSFLLGTIQGLTEFIPVSSTAHLLIGQTLLGIPADDAMFSFLVLVQWGTLVSLFIYFREDLLDLLRAFFAKPFSSVENRLAWYIVIATLPALFFGYLLKDALETLFRTPLAAAAIRLFAAAILLTVAEWFGRRTRKLDDMSWLDALVVGLFQVLAVFPGSSRSGATISGGMLRGFDRPAAARFAFLMSAPVMLAAGAYESLDLLAMPGLGAFLPVLLVGFVSATVVGWLAVRWLMAYLGKHSLYIFAGYCAVVGTLCVTFLFV